MAEGGGGFWEGSLCRRKQENEAGERVGKQMLINTTVMSQVSIKVKWAISLEEVGMSNEISLNDKERQGKRLEISLSGLQGQL